MISLGPLADCQPRELIRMKVEDATEWAIVGAPDPGYFPLIFLTGDKAPFVVNAAPNPSDFADRVAKYGTKHRFLHEPGGPCQIGDGKLSKTAGSLVLIEDGHWLLVVNKYREKGVRWLDLRG